MNGTAYKRLDVISHERAMETKSIEVYSELNNSSVVRMPERQYPGVVIQGDSLFSLFSDSIDLLEELKEKPDSEAFHAAYSVAERLEGHLRHYIEVCEKHGIKWAFNRKKSVLEFEHLIETDL